VLVFTFLFIYSAVFVFLMLVFLSFCSAYKDEGKGSVSQFSGKRIIGVLAGETDTTDAESKNEMDCIVKYKGFLKLYGHGDKFDVNPYDPLQASEASYDPPAPSDGPGNGPTAPSATRHRRVGRLLAPMRGSPMLFRPRLAISRVAGIRLAF
jgi:hypothetical protein